MITLTIHSMGEGTCSLSGKDQEGMTVSFDDGTLSNAFLSNKSFIQLVRMKLTSGNGKPPSQPEAQRVPSVQPNMPHAKVALPDEKK